MKKEGFREFARDWRSAIQIIGNGVKNLKLHPVCVNAIEGVDKGEVIANIMLAYRHLEDARMRLGKAIQATEGGVSCFDRIPDGTNPGERGHPE